ncbi:unnamed protein product, partial [Pleuronectes platessa]
TFYSTQVHKCFQGEGLEACCAIIKIPVIGFPTQPVDRSSARTELWRSPDAAKESDDVLLNKNRNLISIKRLHLSGRSNWLQLNQDLAPRPEPDNMAADVMKIIIYLRLLVTLSLPVPPCPSLCPPAPPCPSSSRSIQPVQPRGTDVAALHRLITSQSTTTHGKTEENREGGEERKQRTSKGD